ncbi:uroplakin-1a isoform X1 [Equus przewalskii]|uniref:Uroplakin-1a n=4 Tax=Equus TaxID=9789 RepID=A0A3Q2I1K6_HORSE|nr:uroplakin-1a isoform X1 [Equus caballus]XP_014588921.2 uroplakin-1a isoform X1 [Equus caballus]XP_023505337.1 uroplakin-1a isoform X1 [Equus caballus]
MLVCLLGLLSPPPDTLPTSLETDPRMGLGVYREPLWEGPAREASGREGEEGALRVWMQQRELGRSELWPGRPHQSLGFLFCKIAHHSGGGRLGTFSTSLDPAESGSSSWELGVEWGWWVQLGLPPLLASAWPLPRSPVSGRTMASAAEEAEKGSPVVVGLLVVGNIVILLSGLALFAETVWVTADQYRVYPLMGVSGKDDVFAGAWIAIFCGFSFFVVASFGVGAALCHRRSMMLTYLVLMLIVYIFECASCITAYTHRDYMVSNPSLITKQMLTFYSADTAQGRELTRLWDRIMTEQECCGTSGPMDWVNFTSAFRAATPEVTFPWPPLCCRRTGNFIPLSEEGCRLGHMDYLFTKGCFEHISHAIDSYTWGISWFGFAILMWTLPVMLIAMYFYTTL